jgi:hypothetical protein
MNGFLRSVVFILCIPMVGCGGGSESVKHPAGSGGSAGGAIGTGGSSAASGGSVGGGGNSVGTGGAAGSVGAGGGSSAANGGSVSAGGNAGGGTAGRGGTGGNGKADAATNADTGQSKGDASVANADQASSNGDGAVHGHECPPFTPCGGDIVGTWRQTDICASPTSYACPMEWWTDWSQTQITYTFGSDGTMVYSAAGTLSETIRYPIECLSSNADAGIGQACADLEAGMQSAMQNADAGSPLTSVTSFSCSVDPDETCMCSEIFSISPITATGSYVIDGHQIALTITGGTLPVDGGLGDAGTSSPSDYCVSGNTATFHSIGSSGEDVFLTLTR